MAIKKKNLTKDDINDVYNYENENKIKINDVNRIKLEDIKIEVKCLNEKQKELKKLIENKEICIIQGPAGVGKTYFSLLMALHLLKTEPQYKKIVLMKSLQVVKGEELGYLKGDLDTKILPYNYSYIGNLDKIFGSKYITKSFMDSGIIEIFPIAFARGCDFDNCILIIDEIQNISMNIFKTIITRIGKNSKMIFLGDSEQCDLSNKKESCMKTVMRLFKDTDFIGTLEFNIDDCVRNPIIPKILDILDKEKLQ